MCWDYAMWVFPTNVWDDNPLFVCHTLEILAMESDWRFERRFQVSLCLNESWLVEAWMELEKVVSVLMETFKLTKKWTLIFSVANQALSQNWSPNWRENRKYLLFRYMRTPTSHISLRLSSHCLKSHLRHFQIQWDYIKVLDFLPPNSNNFSCLYTPAGSHWLQGGH